LREPRFRLFRMMVPAKTQSRKENHKKARDIRGPFSQQALRYEWFD
jgi:hypothetical protein